MWTLLKRVHLDENELLGPFQQEFLKQLCQGRRNLLLFAEDIDPRILLLFRRKSTMEEQDLGFSISLGALGKLSKFLRIPTSSTFPSLTDHQPD